jgi:tRNA-binding protein
MSLATIEDFQKLELRAGRIIAAEAFPEAKKPAYQLTIDFGPLGIKRSSAQITSYYSVEDLVGRTIIAVTNFPPRRIAGFESEVLVLGVEDAEHRVVLLEPEREVELGSSIS